MARPTHVSRALSQNFLTDRATADRFARIAVPRPHRQPLLLEVGAGKGALTEVLAPRCRELLAYEIDPRLVPALRARFSGTPQVRVIGGDFLAARPPGGPFSVAGNVPFSRTADVVDWCLRAPGLMDATLLTQLEYARKRTGDYGSWTLSPSAPGRATSGGSSGGSPGPGSGRCPGSTQESYASSDAVPRCSTRPPTRTGGTWSSWASRGSVVRCMPRCAGPTRGAGWMPRSGPRVSTLVRSSGRCRPSSGWGSTTCWGRDEPRTRGGRN